MRRRPIFCADINLAAAEKTAGIIRSEGGEAVANRADEEQTSPTAANLALLRRTNATAPYSIEAICIGALWCADRTLPGVTPTKNHANCPLSVDRRSPEGLMVLRRTKTTALVPRRTNTSSFGCGNCLKLVQFFERNNRIAAAWNADTQQG